MANKAKRKIETVEYIVFDKNNIAEAEEFTKSKITFSKKFSSKEFDVFVIDSGIDRKHIHNFDIITKDEKGVINIWEYTTFIKFFEKFDPSENAAKKTTAERITEAFQTAVEPAPKEKFFFIPELETTLDFYEITRTQEPDESPEDFERRKNAGNLALAQFCRGLLVGAKLSRQY